MQLSETVPLSFISIESGPNRYWLRTVQHVVEDDQRKHNGGCYYCIEWLAVDLVALNHLNLTDIA